MKDTATGTTVKKLGGDVIMGATPGTVWIEVIATPKTSGATLKKRYEINISAVGTDITFTPNFTHKDTYDGSIVVNTKYTGSSYSKAAALLPKYKITQSGTIKDVTDEFDVTLSYSGSSQMYLSSDKKKIQFDQKMSIPSGTHEGVLTYTFTSKTDKYDTFTKRIYVSLNTDGYSDPKKDLTLSLTTSHFKQVNVTQAVGVNEGYPTAHVYKYGQSDLEGSTNNYQYKTPTPSLLVEGTQLPLNVTGGGGSYGDFKLIYQIVKDETYFDDCEFLYSSRAGSVQRPGEPTGLTIGEYMYQVSKPGIVKVAVYAVLDEGSYGTNLKAMYNAVPDPENSSEDWVITDQWGGRYVVFAQPQYFYIEVMKRQPTIQLSPDPTHLQFIQGDVIEMNDRFEISAIKGTDSNGIAGALKWGADDGSGDHFAYQFFISDRSHIDIDWNKDWDPTDSEQYGDIYSYRDWRKTGYVKSNNEPLRVGDIIKTGNTITFTADEDFDVATAGDASRNLIGQMITIGGKEILVTPDNIGVLAGVKSGKEYTVNEYVLISSDEDITKYSAEPYNHGNIATGDFEKGITYNSMKGYGNEDWTMTFKSNGTYNIPYTVRPWNHVRWDNSAEQTITFEVTGTPEPTEIVLSYYYQVATLGQSSFNEPTAKVVTTKDKYDVTKYFDITYSITDGNGGTLNGVTGLYEHTATGTTINPTTGEVTIGSTATGDVIITVHGARKSSGPASYGNPSDVTYTIHIVSSAGLAQWEVISSCDNSCDLPSDPTLRRFATMDEANGRMHFYGVGTIYGGTVIEGVPGIDMTVGVPTGDATTEWTAEETTLNDEICCSHEDGHKSVIVTSSSNVVLDENGIPASGAFYTFKPSVNGFLTVDANFKNNHSVVLRSLNSITGETLDEKFYNETGADVIGDHLFTYPLLAGQTYYLFDETDGRELRLHGFGYQPAFIMDRSTTKAQSEAPLSASTFLNSLMRDIPELYKGSNSNVTFAVSDPSGRAVGGASDYLEIGGDGALDPKQMTVDGSGVFKLRVTATVKSSDPALSEECTRKTTSYDIQIIDIPTFKIGKYFSTETPAEGTTNYQDLEGMGVGYVAETTNIKTAMQMTFGGCPVGSYQAVRPNGEVATRTDGWLYNNKADEGVTTSGHRIEGHHAGDTWDYDKIIDNFSYFTAGKENPVNEEGNGPLVESPLSPNNGANYTYGNGVDYEQDESFYYNTTYRVPSRGAYLKFEPRESGTLIVYLWMNGSCDYHFEDGSDGYNADKVLGSIGNSYKLKWRPLYITDETGKPVTMVNKFGNVSKYLDAGDDLENAGSYTLGLARCNKTETTIDNYITGTVGVGSVVLRDGCSFDWSEFRGTDADAARLLAAWPEKGERESIIRLDNGGFAIPHKAYVRFAFDVKAGKTYFLFQQGSKPGFGGYSFVPVGFPDECTYAVTSTPTSYSKNATTQEKLWNGGATTAGTDPDDDITFTWDKSSTMFNSNVENLSVTINDRRNSEIATDPTLIKRNFTSGKWESLCLPFSVSESEMKDVFGDDYMLVTCDGVYTYKDNSDNKVVTDEILFTRHANGYVEAGRPYLVKPSDDGTFTFKNVSIEGAESVTDYNGVVYRVPNPTRFTVGINNEEFIFKGVYMRETMPRGSYFVYNGDAEHPNGLYRYNADAKIGGYRAYFQLQSGRPEAALMSSFSIRDVKFAEADIETGILAINKDGSVTEIPRNAGIYTIDGQKLSDNPLDFNKLPSGIYIVDGKKYVK